MSVFPIAFSKTISYADCIALPYRDRLLFSFSLFSEDIVRHTDYMNSTFLGIADEQYVIDALCD